MNWEKLGKINGATISAKHGEWTAIISKDGNFTLTCNKYRIKGDLPEFISLLVRLEAFRQEYFDPQEL